MIAINSKVLHMKSWLYFFSCLSMLLPLNSSAQVDYVPMDTITDWKVEAGAFGSNWEYWYDYTGDTVINALTYRIIQYEAFQDYFVDLYFREDPTTRKVYKYEPNDSMEILYYDFGLEVGEDFYVAFSSTYFTVTEIDTVQSEVGPLKRWRFDHAGLYFTYTEAIGGHPLDYQYWIYVQDPTHFTSCTYHYCELISGSEDCSPPPFRAIYASIDTTLCEGESYMGISQSGVYVDTLISASGCDSILTINLSIEGLILVSIDTTICAGDTFFGFTEQGTYMETLSGVLGCDTIFIIDITVLPPIQSFETHALCPGEEIYGYSEEGVYELILPSETGCDTILTLIITELPGDDPACITATSDQHLMDIKLFPNPVKDRLQIQSEQMIYKMDIIDAQGHILIKEDSFDLGSSSFDLTDLPAGIYFIHIKGSEGSGYWKILKI